MATISRTIDQAAHREVVAETEPVPGLLLVFSSDEALCSPLPLEDQTIALGRGKVRDANIQDGCMSRQHAEIGFAGGVWTIRDLGSRNGTHLDGVRVSGEVKSEAPRVIRCGDSIFLPFEDIRPFQVTPMDAGGSVIMGATLKGSWDAIGRAAEHGDVLHVTGESGSGKELAARAFHEKSARAGGSFIPVNCAAIPEQVAERLLFGAKKGAYSGADADADGYIQAANGGTLFLDEVGELSLAVQAKLLRVLEAREVLPLGASRPKSVLLNFCSATHRGLRGEVAAKRFREDLYFRMGRPEVALPPLRERREEIAYLVARELRKTQASLSPEVSLIEAVLLRRWPGNVRELIAESKDAARAALAAKERRVGAARLSANAGLALEPADETPVARERTQMPKKGEIEESLRRANGRVATAARELGIHRTQLRRWLTKHDIDPRAYGDEED